MENDNQISPYDRLRGGLNAVYARPSTFKNVEETTGQAETYTIEVGRTDHGDYCFVERVDKNLTVTRIALPPKVLNAIARQCTALGKRVRSRKLRDAAKARMASGWKPSFARKA